MRSGRRWACSRPKINQMKSDLARASIVDPDKLPKDEVAFGATVAVRDLDYDDEEEFTLVGKGDEDYDSGKYLITSPVGQGLLGKKGRRPGGNRRAQRQAAIRDPQHPLRFDVGRVNSCV